jgi:lipoate-protein ligase B
MGIRDYICHLQTALKTLLRDRHGVVTGTSEHTGVFLDERTKVGSIGVQVRHRLTTHGVALNVTEEPRGWFDQIVACGLTEVRAGSVMGAVRALAKGKGGDGNENGNGKMLNMEEEAWAFTEVLGKQLGRKMEVMDVKNMGEIGEAIAELEQEAAAAGACPPAPAIRES